jgi:hypothetical protein
MNVISSMSSLFNFERENISRIGLMKRYALLFDGVVFNRYGAPIGNDDICETLGEFVSMLVSTGETPNERKQLGKNKRFSEIFIDCWDLVENPEEFERQKFHVLDEASQKRVGDFCFSEVRRLNGLSSDSYKFDIDDVRELSGDITSDIGLNLLALAEGVDIVPSYSPIISRALNSEAQHNGGKTFELFQSDLVIPDFESFSWDEILELRNDKYIHSFRSVVHGLLQKEENIDKALIERVQVDLWSLAADVQPNVRQTYLEAIGSNLPSPVIINPIGVAASLRDIYQAKQMERKYGHVYFVQKLKSIQS